MAVPSATAPSVVASARAEPAAAARSRSPGDGGESASTATVATAEASHQPASRSGSMLTVPGVTTDSTNGNSAAMTPDAALGPATPAKNMPNVTGIVTRTASQSSSLTAVPMIRPMLPVSASPRCAMALSRLLPPNEATTRFANPPNAANRAIWRSPKPTKVSANTEGITSTARTARMAAVTDQDGHHDGRAPVGPARPAGGAEDRNAARGRRRLTLRSGTKPV